MHFTLLSPGDKRWAAFLTRAEHDVYHLPGYADLLSRERQAPAYACYGESDDAALLLPLLFESVPHHLGLRTDLRDARSPDGYPGPLFVGDSSKVRAALNDLVAFLRRSRVITCFIRVHPLLGLRPEAFEGVAIVFDRGRTIQIVLDSPYEEILGQMRQGHRYEIRKAYQAGYRLEIDRWERLPLLVSFYRSLMKRVDAATPYRFSDGYFERYRESVGESAHIATVLDSGGTPAAAALFTLRCGIVQYHVAANDPRFEKDAVQKLVVDGLIRFGLDHKAKTVHLGGGVGARSDSLLHFKEGFSRNGLTYRTIHLVSDPSANVEAVAAWTKLHGGGRTETDFFPAYRAPVSQAG